MNYKATLPWGQFIGNHCSKLLIEVDKLEKLLVNSEACIGVQYFETFLKFKLVKDMYFGFNFYEGYEVAIENFKISNLNLDIPISLRVDFFQHPVHFCKKHNSGLSLYSEHSVESSHYDFKPFWEKNPTKLQ